MTPTMNADERRCERPEAVAGNWSREPFSDNPSGRRSFSGMKLVGLALLAALSAVA